MVFCSSGGVTCEPFPPERGFGILSGVSHHTSYTVIVGGSMSSEAFHGMGCMKVWLLAAIIVVIGPTVGPVPARYVRHSQMCPQLDVSDKNDQKTQDMSDKARFVRQE